MHTPDEHLVHWWLLASAGWSSNGSQVVDSKVFSQKPQEYLSHWCWCRDPEILLNEQQSSPSFPSCACGISLLSSPATGSADKRNRHKIFQKPKWNYAKTSTRQGRGNLFLNKSKIKYSAFTMTKFWHAQRILPAWFRSVDL